MNQLHEIKYGPIDQTPTNIIKKQVEFKYPGYKVHEVYETNGMIYVQFFSENKESRRYSK